MNDSEITITMIDNLLMIKILAQADFAMCSAIARRRARPLLINAMECTSLYTVIAAIMDTIADDNTTNETNRTSDRRLKAGVAALSRCADVRATRRIHSMHNHVHLV